MPAKLKQKRTDNEWISKLSPDVVQKILGVVDGDGHTIFDPKAFLEEGIPQEIVDRFTVVHKSGHTPKSKIFGDRGVYEAVCGVYGLNMLQDIAEQLGLKGWEHLAGRGFRARAITEVLHNWVQEQRGVQDE